MSRNVIKRDEAIEAITEALGCGVYTARKILQHIEPIRLSERVFRYRRSDLETYLATMTGQPAAASA